MLAEQEELINIRNLGKKSMDEISDVCGKIESGVIQVGEYTIEAIDTEITFTLFSNKVIDKVEKPDCEKSIDSVSFYNLQGILVEDLHIDDLRLSVRATNA